MTFITGRQAIDMCGVLLRQGVQSGGSQRGVDGVFQGELSGHNLGTPKLWFIGVNIGLFLEVSLF